MDYLILISINSFQKVVSTPMPQEGKRENSRVFCKVFYKKYFRLPRALEKYRKLYISPLEIPYFPDFILC